MISLTKHRGHGPFDTLTPPRHKYGAMADTGALRIARGDRVAQAPRRIWEDRERPGATMDYQQGFTSGPAT